MTTVEPLILTREEVRSIDAMAISELGISGLVLMENAARGVADVLFAEYAGAKRRVIISGFGNNGGDGFALARQLAAGGETCELWLVRAGKKLSPDAAANLSILEAAGIPICEPQDFGELASLTAADVIIDCLLGTGVRGSVRAPFDTAIAAINRCAARVVAVDVPSGFDCETGAPHGECVKAERTVTLVGLKKGFTQSLAKDYIGRVSVAHIGLPDEWVRTWIAQRRS